MFEKLEHWIAEEKDYLNEMRELIIRDGVSNNNNHGGIPEEFCNVSELLN
jgi:hypothetical protein